MERINKVGNFNLRKTLRLYEKGRYLENVSLIETLIQISMKSIPNSLIDKLLYESMVTTFHWYISALRRIKSVGSVR